MTTHISMTLAREEPGALTLRAETDRLGTQYDHHATLLTFIRPAETETYQLIAYFSSPGKRFAPLQITGDAFLVPNSLTQDRQLELQVGFARDVAFLMRSNSVVFTLRPGVRDGAETTAPRLDTYGALVDGAFTDVLCEDGLLIMKNLSGEVVAETELLVSEGGAGTGARGPKGDTGEPGPTGPQGPKGDSGDPGTGGGGQIEATYAELVALIAGDGLQPGAQYVLTDYITRYRQPYSNRIAVADVDQSGVNHAGGPSTGTVERLVLTAVSKNAFSPQCASLDWPDDIVMYDFHDNLCEDDTTPRTGFILRRVDTVHRVDMPHDWRTMLWARFKATGKKWTAGLVYRGFVRQNEAGTMLYLAMRYGSPGNLATDKQYFLELFGTAEYVWTGGWNMPDLTYDMADYAERYTFNASGDMTEKEPTRSDTLCPVRIRVEAGTTLADGLANNVFMFSAESSMPYDITAEGMFWDNTFGDGCYDLIFGTLCHGNLFSDHCHAVTFGAKCSGNILQSGSFEIDFRSGCFDNIFGRYIESLSFGPSCYGNFINDSCTANSFGVSCHSNSLGNGCTGNVFSTLCQSNSISGNFHRNMLEPGISSKDMMHITELYGRAYSHRLFKNTAGNVYSVHYVNTTPTYVSVP